VTTPAGVALLAPTNFTVQLAIYVAGAGADSVLLNWTNNSSGQTGYRVQRCSVGACGATSVNWATVLTLPANATSATHTANLTIGTNYRYRVAALNGTVVGPYSAVANMNFGTGPAAATGLAGTPGAVGAPFTVNLTWIDNANNNATYDLQRCAGSVATCAAGVGAWVTVSATIGANATSYVATLPAAGNYRFRIRAVNPNGNSTWDYTAGVIAAQ